MIKSIYRKLRLYTKIKTVFFFPKIRNKTKCPISSLLFNMLWKVLATAIKQEKETKDINWRGKNKCPYLLTILFPTRKSQGIYEKTPRTEFIKIRGYKVNTQK